MAEVLVQFACGHIRSFQGNESELVCSCGSKEVARITAPAPTFTGHALGPCAQTNLELPAVPVTFKEEKE